MSLSLAQNSTEKTTGNDYGFTLVELVIVMLVVCIIMAGVSGVYQAQTRASAQNENIADIQQNLRGAVAVMTTEIRQAGCDPTKNADAGIVSATATRLQFTADLAGNPVNPNDADGIISQGTVIPPGVNENITYGFGAGIDVNNNGIVDNGGADWSMSASLGRTTITGGAMQPFADNIEAIEFNYILMDGTVTNGSGIPSPAQTNTSISNPNDIRTVQISILGRSNNPSQNYRNTETYTTASGLVWNPPDDAFRRRLVIVNIYCRNMGW
ncbi:MAG: PilW family protein [Thermodesulfobacteriota bacterium]